MFPRIILFGLGLFICVSGAVVDLTDSNFDQHIDGSSHALVEFFAPWYAMLLTNYHDISITHI